MKILFILGLIIYPFCHSARADNQNGSEEFKPSKVIKYARPYYPYEQRKKWNSGLVKVGYMVDKAGTPYEPMIMLSTKKTFEEAALQAVTNYKLQPATLNGKAVDSFRSIVIKFTITDLPDGVSTSFANAYKSALKELAKSSPNKKKVLHKIGRLEAQKTLTAYAYGRLNLLKYNFATVFGNVKDRTDALEQLLIFDGQLAEDRRLLSTQQKIKIRRDQFELYSYSQKFSEALFAYDELLKVYPEAESEYANEIAAINEIKTNKKAISTKIEIESRWYSSLYLFKPTFTLLDVEGKIEKLKLRCQRKYLELDFNPEAEYRVPKRFGQCHLQIMGKQHTTFNLVQY